MYTILLRLCLSQVVWNFLVASPRSKIHCDNQSREAPNQMDHLVKRIFKPILKTKTSWLPRNHSQFLQAVSANRPDWRAMKQEWRRWWRWTQSRRGRSWSSPWWQWGIRERTLRRPFRHCSRDKRGVESTQGKMVEEGYGPLSILHIEPVRLVQELTKACSTEF